MFYIALKRLIKQRKETNENKFVSFLYGQRCLNEINVSLEQGISCKNESNTL